MTWALCLNCGEVKFGAICPCPKCQVHSTGDMQLDICFTDHNWERETLEELGAVIAAIQPSSDDPHQRYWAFLHYVSENHPEILRTPLQELRVDLPPKAQRAVEHLLSAVPLPSVTLRKTCKRLWMEEILRRATAKQRSETEARSRGVPPLKKPWWKFW